MATNGMLTLNQFWSVYQAEWVVDPFTAKFYSLIQNNIGLNGCIYYTHKLRMQWRIKDFPEEGAPTYDFAIFSPKTE